MNNYTTNELMESSIKKALDVIPDKENDVMGMEQRRELIEIGEKVLGLFKNGASPQVIKTELGKLEESLNDYESPKTTSQIRAKLEEISTQARVEQNRIFNICVEESGNSNFIDTIMQPKTIEVSPSSEENTIKDYVSRLLEKDSSGNYVLPDKTFANFIDWYHHSLIKLEKKVKNLAHSHEKVFVDSVYRAINDKDGILPRSFTRNVRVLDEKSNQYRPPDYVISDFSSRERNYGSGWYSTNIIALKPIKNKKKNVEINVSDLNHEDVHHCTNNLLFINDNDAYRVFNEGMAETLSRLILHYQSPESGMYRFGDGEAYSVERKTLLYLCNNGRKKIDPKILIEAYTELPDKSFLESIAKMDIFKEWYADMSNKNNRRSNTATIINTSFDINNPSDQYIAALFAARNHIYRPAEKRLYEAIYDAFPSCRTPEDICELINTKFDLQLSLSQ